MINEETDLLSVAGEPCAKINILKRLLHVNRPDLADKSFRDVLFRRAARNLGLKVIGSRGNVVETDHGVSYWNGEFGKNALSFPELESQVRNKPEALSWDTHLGTLGLRYIINSAETVVAFECELTDIYLVEMYD